MGFFFLYILPLNQDTKSAKPHPVKHTRPNSQITPLAFQLWLIPSCAHTMEIFLLHTTLTILLQCHVLAHLNWLALKVILPLRDKESSCSSCTFSGYFLSGIYLLFFPVMTVNLVSFLVEDN